MQALECSFFLSTFATLSQVSWRTVKQELSHRTPPTGHHHSNIGAQGIHTVEGREAFLAQPLPTSDSGHGSHNDEDDEDYDEEIAVDFKSSRSSPKVGAPTSSSVVSTSGSARAVQLRNPTSAAATAVGGGTTGGTTGNAAAPVQGAGRGAALMRRYEGNQRPAALASATAPPVPPATAATVTASRPSTTSAVVAAAASRSTGNINARGGGGGGGGGDHQAELEETDL